MKLCITYSREGGSTSFFSSLPPYTVGLKNACPTLTDVQKRLTPPSAKERLLVNILGLWSSFVGMLRVE